MIEDLFDSKMEDKFKVLRDSALIELWLSEPALLCEVLNYRHRIVLDKIAKCYMPQGYRCKYNCDNMICGYDREEK